MARTNRYASSCAKCGAHVAAEAGTLTGPPWKTYCASCLAPPAVSQRPRESRPIAKITLRSRTVEVRLEGYAGRAIFDQYRSACAPCKARKVGGEWHNEIPLADARPVLEEMRSIEGLAVEVDEEILEALTDRAEDVEAKLAAAHERLAIADEQLARRGMALYPYQHSGVEWLATQEGAILADDMGLGKTVQALISAPAGAPILVVSPAVAKGVWVREAAKWRPDLIPVALKGRKSFRWPEPGEMVVTNYDILSDEIPPAPEGVVVIADEAHAVKNTKAKRTTRFRTIADYARAARGYVWLLTATPLLGKPPELWALLQAIERTPFSGFKEFARMMGGHQEWIQVGRRTVQVWQWDGIPSGAVADRLQPVMLRRMKTEVLTDLPAKRHRDLPVDGLTATQKKALDKSLGAWDAVARPDQLPAFEQMSAARAMLAKSKIPAMMALVEEYEEAGEPVVVFSSHRAPVLALAELPGWAIITGDTSPAERTAIEDEFQRGNLKGVAATIQAGGVAITLTRAAHAIFVDLDWTPALNSQAEDRIYRIGQTRGVLITRLIADHKLDERLAAVLSHKQDIIEASVDSARRGAESFAGGEGERLDALAEGLAADTAALVADLEGVLDAQAAFQARLAELEADERHAAERKLECDWQGAIEHRAHARGVSIMDAEDQQRRDAQTDAEWWAYQGLISLAMRDTDRATSKNDIGFNKPDSQIGHMLAMRADEGLSNAEWQLAQAMLAKYWRQIGEAP